MSPASPPPTLRETRSGLRVVLLARSTEVASDQVQALDSVAAVLARDPDPRAVVRYTDAALDGTSASARLAERAQDHLILRGVAPDRVRLDRVNSLAYAGVPPGTDAVEIVVTRAARRDR